MVYDLSDEEYDELDRISGVDRGYYERVEFTVYGDDDELSATTYVMPHPGGPFQPTSAYVRPILAGAAALHLPADYQAELAETVGAATGHNASVLFSMRAAGRPKAGVGRSGAHQHEKISPENHDREQSSGR